MITRPVAIVRSLLATFVVWVFGACATYVVFKVLGYHTTIKDLPGHADRVQIIWWGAHAFWACAATLVGIVVGSTALTGAFLAEQAEALRLVGTPVAVVSLGALAVLTAAGTIGNTMFAASAVGLLIGVIGAASFVVLRGSRDEPDPVFARGPHGRTTGQSWGSR